MCLIFAKLLMDIIFVFWIKGNCAFIPMCLHNEEINSWMPLFQRHETEQDNLTQLHY